MIVSFRRVLRGLGLLIVAPTLFALWLSCSVAVTLVGVSPGANFVEIMGMFGLMVAGAGVLMTVLAYLVKFILKLWEADAKITLWSAKKIPEARVLNKDSSHVKS